MNRYKESDKSEETFTVPIPQCEWQDISSSTWWSTLTPTSKVDDDKGQK
jgi:hypothetical protein